MSLRGVLELYLYIVVSLIVRVFPAYFTPIHVKEICPRGNNNIVIIIFLVHDNVYNPC
jgi:hypothetical protein